MFSTVDGMNRSSVAGKACNTIHIWGLSTSSRASCIDIIEWTDDSRDTLSWRFPDDDKAIKNGAQLIVRESQVAQFVYLGEFGDTFRPGKHTLTTDNIPVLTKLKSWKFGFNSPFKADVYFVITRLFTGNKWGTSNPVMLRDKDFGIVARPRLRHLRLQDRRAEDVPARGGRLRPQLPPRRVRRHDALAHRQHLQRRRRVGEDPGARRGVALHASSGEALLPLINPAVVDEVRHRDHAASSSRTCRCRPKSSRRSTSARAWPPSATSTTS